MRVLLQNRSGSEGCALRRLPEARRLNRASGLPRGAHGGEPPFSSVGTTGLTARLSRGRYKTDKGLFVRRVECV